MSKKIGFIGAGVMGSAIIKGIINSKFVKKEDIVASEYTEEAASKVEKELKIKVVLDNLALIKHCDVIVIATKPFVVDKVLEEIKEVIDGNKLIISIAAGITTKYIEEIVGKKVPVIRSMPNTPSLVNEGMTAVCKGKFATDEDVAYATELFSKVGKCVEVNEKQMDAVTGVSGSGPAFMYLIIDALADGGVRLGLTKKVALELAAQTALGAAKMILETGKHPAILKDEVTTPGGTTAEGLFVLESNAIKGILEKTVEKTAIKSAGGKKQAND